MKDITRLEIPIVLPHYHKLQKFRRFLEVIDKTPFAMQFWNATNKKASTSAIWNYMLQAFLELDEQPELDAVKDGELVTCKSNIKKCLVNQVGERYSKVPVMVSCARIIAYGFNHRILPYEECIQVSPFHPDA